MNTEEQPDFEQFVTGQDLLLSHKSINLHSQFNASVKPVQKHARSIVKDRTTSDNSTTGEPIDDNFSFLFEELEDYNLSEPPPYFDDNLTFKTEHEVASQNRQNKIVVADDAKLLREGVAYFNYLADQILGPEQFFDKRQLHHPLIGVVMKSVDVTFNTRCAFDLKYVADFIRNVEVMALDERNRVLNLRIPRCKATANVHAAGRVFCSVTSNAEMARRVARRLLHALAQLHYKVSFSKFRVLEVHGIGYMPWNVDIKRFAKCYSQWVRYKRSPVPMAQAIMSKPTAKANIFYIGAVNITVIAAEQLDVALQRIHSYLKPFCRIRSPNDNRIVQHLMRYGNYSGGFDFNLTEDI